MSYKLYNSLKKMKPSKGLKELWRKECVPECAKFIWITKALPVGRYERCISTCIKRKEYNDYPIKKKPYISSNTVENASYKG